MSLSNLITFLNENDIPLDDVDFIAGHKEVYAWFPAVEDITYPEADEDDVIDQETGMVTYDNSGDNFIVQYFEEKYGLYYQMDTGFLM